MKHLIIGASVALLVVVSGCSTRQKLLDIPGVSMTNTPYEHGGKLQDKGPVTGEFCAQQFSDKGEIGLIDEAIKNTQATYKVDFITNVTIWTSSNSCIVIEGTGQTLVSQK